ncbi:DUF4349 domain-containing protein [Chryseobacterium sp. HSC-36S06]|uniref:DUF4349 domain-containing protein n=1 Tax=Chryseobacterium sp. HSC-36S06 TaxID=2910970 RepID=UPI00209D629B|nr:DUF4349 domain-containing protein [Chryseobacterium sp. HSC-36S06]MCP2037932.1 hypothetical protein [Chryseobacterium sp. HSC-36S06]
MKIKIILFALMTIISCSKNEPLAVETEVNAALMEVIPEDAARNSKSSSVKSDTAPAKNDSIAKKIIKNGEMGLAVANINEAKSKVDGILKKQNAYTQSETFNNTETSEDLNLVIRVPHENFDQLISSFADGIGAVEYKNISSEDVTEEYTDVAIKLENKRIYLDKYRNLLKNAATTKDMLEIQENIRKLEDEIDVAEGRLRFIDDRVNYSTLRLSLSKEKPRSSVTSKIGFGSRFSDSVAQGWNIFVSFVLGLISLWPFLILTPFIIMFYRKWRSRKKQSTFNDSSHSNNKD